MTRLPNKARLAGAVVGVSIAALCTAPPAAAEVVNVTGTTIVASMRGNGHGHGMSQYGARGAAIAGLSYSQILRFYYPGTALVRLTPQAIRVKVTRAGADVPVAAAPDLYVTGVSVKLLYSGVLRYRLQANSGSGTLLQRLSSAPGARWQTIFTNLPNGAQFHRSSWAAMRLYLPDGSSAAYGGYLRAVRVSTAGTSGGVITVNVVSLDRYTAGVVPREVPASWQRAAVDAQAVAARTYGRYAVAHPSSASYDICDTTACQVYGGAARYDPTGRLLDTEFWGPATDTSNLVLSYGGYTAFTQFSASNGGWTVYGGQPYQPAKADPYDNAASGDPYLSYSRTVSVASIARYYGLTKITKFEITARDGHGAAGGRMLAGYVTGPTSSGVVRRVATTGYQLQSALGSGTTWITVRNP